MISGRKFVYRQKKRKRHIIVKLIHSLIRSETKNGIILLDYYCGVQNMCINKLARKISKIRGKLIKLNW